MIRGPSPKTGRRSTGGGGIHALNYPGISIALAACGKAIRYLGTQKNRLSRNLNAT